MKRKLIPLLLFAAILTGCSSEPVQSTVSLPPLETESSGSEAAPSSEEVTEPARLTGLIYYADDHGTRDPAQLSGFSAAMESTGRTWQTGSIADVPAAPDTLLVLDAPAEDITQSDLAAVDALLDAGGHMLLLLPANEAPVRYKFLERVLEDYSVRIDYDVVTDETPGRSSGGTGNVLMEQVAVPEDMSIPEDIAAKPLFLEDVRSFHFFYIDDYTYIRQDAILEAGSSAVGTPCGGIEDDPETFEGEQLMTMVWSRNQQRGNSSIVAIGADSFLADGSFDAGEPSPAAVYVMAAVNWLMK